MSQRLHTIHGILARIDLVSREVELTGKPALPVVTVPPDCKVFLHGERVKLRMLQPGDSVKITCLARADALVARTLEVPADRPLSGHGTGTITNATQLQDH